jgi:putative addiction module killer protein
LFLSRVQVGLFGDARFLGGRVHELRIDHGPGYRVYFARRGESLILLLSGGDKGSQARDIALAQSLADRWMEGFR